MDIQSRYDLSDAAMTAMIAFLALLTAIWCFCEAGLIGQKYSRIMTRRTVAVRNAKQSDRIALGGWLVFIAMNLAVAVEHPSLACGLAGTAYIVRQVLAKRHLVRPDLDLLPAGR